MCVMPLASTDSTPIDDLQCWQTLQRWRPELALTKPTHADHLWWSSGSSRHSHAHKDTHHPHRAAPRCAPCGYARNTSGLPFPAPPGCPCTPALLCAAAPPGPPCLCSSGLDANCMCNHHACMLQLLCAIGLPGAPCLRASWLLSAASTCLNCHVGHILQAI